MLVRERATGDYESRRKPRHSREFFRGPLPVGKDDLRIGFSYDAERSFPPVMLACCFTGMHVVIAAASRQATQLNARRPLIGKRYSSLLTQQTPNTGGVLMENCRLHVDGWAHEGSRRAGGDVDALQDTKAEARRQERPVGVSADAIRDQVTN